MASILKKKLNASNRTAIYRFAAPMMDARPERTQLEEARKELTAAVRRYGDSLWKQPGHRGTLKMYDLTDTISTLHIEHDNKKDGDLEYFHSFSVPLWEEGQEMWNPAKGLGDGFLERARHYSTVASWRHRTSKYEGGGRTVAERAGFENRLEVKNGVELPQAPNRYRTALPNNCPEEKHRFAAAYEAWEAAWLANLGMLDKALRACVTWEDVVKTLPQIAKLPGWRGFYTQQLAPTTAIVPSQEFYEKAKALPFMDEVSAAPESDSEEA
jgi:hypothetical protein